MPLVHAQREPVHSMLLSIVGRPEKLAQTCDGDCGGAVWPCTDPQPSFSRCFKSIFWSPTHPRGYHERPQMS